MMREGMSVRGLNTAATLWCAAAVGTLAGSGFLPHAVVGAGFIITTHLVYRPLATNMNRSTTQNLGGERLYILRIVCRSNSEHEIRTLFVQLIVQESLLLQSVESEDIQGTDNVEVKAYILATGQQDTQMERVVGLLSLDQAVSAASWKNIPQMEE